MQDKFTLNPFTSETSNMWLLIYIGTLNWAVLHPHNMYYVLISLLVARIQLAIHTLTHEPKSTVNMICNHDCISGIIISTIGAFAFESIFTTDVVYQKKIHDTHHRYPTDKNLDLSYHYIAGPYKSFESVVRCFFQPEIEFYMSFNFQHVPIILSVIIRICIYYVFIVMTSATHIFNVVCISRAIRTGFYFISFHLQHVLPDNTLIPNGKNWEPSYMLYVAGFISGGMLSVDELIGHAVHHTFSTRKSRNYNATPTHLFLT